VGITISRRALACAISVLALALPSTLSAQATDTTVDTSAAAPSTTLTSAAQAAAKKVTAVHVKAARAKKVARARARALKKISLPASGNISAHFGQRSGHWTLRHTGIDFDANYGAPVHAVMKGRVIRVNHHAGSYGQLIVIRNKQGVDFWYAHLSKTSVHVGQNVKSGQFIGKVGSSGNTTGPHLHLEVRRSDMPVDPAKFLWGKFRGKITKIWPPRWTHSSKIEHLNDI